MYQVLLSQRYLFRKAIPLLAMFSVALCTAMVIIVLSVMGGFLDMLTKAGRAQVGDVSVQAYLRGFPNHEELAAEILKLPEAEAATSIVEGVGLLKIRTGDTFLIQAIGIDGVGFDSVTGYEDSLFWRVLTAEEQEEVSAEDWRHDEETSLTTDAELKRWFLETKAKEGMSLRTEDGLPGLVMGIEISPFNERLGLHSYKVMDRQRMVGSNVTMSVIPITDDGGFVQAESRKLEVVNEFSVGRYDIDSQQVFVPFEVLQKMLKMHPMSVRTFPKLDIDGNAVRDEFDEIIYERIEQPGRASRLLVRAAEGVTSEDLQDAVEKMIEGQWRNHPEWRMLTVKTWEEQIEGFLGAVKKETALVTTLFSIISLVSVFLVLAIFWTIVQQKTRDIGTLRAVGASGFGIMWMFLRYGTIIGILGALLGAGIAYTIVWNINPIHEFIGEVTHTYIWDPKVYYFDQLPSEVNGWNALIIMAGGVTFAIMGALVPSILAARVDPVTALRYE